MLLKPTIRKFLPDWGERIHYENDALGFCANHRIIFKETDLIEEPGEYRVRRGTHFIFLNRLVDFNSRSWVIWHEIGHFILHPVSCARFSDAVTKRKIEMQANLVAAVALMPTYLIRTKTLLEIKQEYNYPLRLILLRKQFSDDLRF